MGEDIKRMYIDSTNLKNALLQNNNIDILLCLAKYNPRITVSAIVKKFGKESLRGLNVLREFRLVREDKDYLTLTEEGIFQVEGLLTLAV